MHSSTNAAHLSTDPFCRNLRYGIAHKTKFKTVRFDEREKDGRNGRGKTTVNQKKINKERGGNGVEGVTAEAVHARYFPCLFSITPRKAAVRCRQRNKARQ